MNKAIHRKEPLIHITKRTEVSKRVSLLMHLGAILIALLFCGLLITLISGVNPISVYVEMYNKSFGDDTNRMKMIHSTAFLLIITLAVTPAFKMKFWNIGAEGQVLVGGLAAAFCMTKLGPYLVEPLLLPVMFIVCILAGVIWAVIPAICKAFWNTNETLFTLMMNYIATTLVMYYNKVTDLSGRSDPGIINERTGYGYLPKLFGQNYLLNIVIIAFVTVLMYIYLKYTKQGYEISVVGESPKTAKYVGINVKKVIIRTMVISGAVCGLAGLLKVAGSPTPTLKTDIVGGQGFTAVLVAWMAGLNPLTTVVVSALIILLRDGGASAANTFKIDSNIGDIVMAIVIFGLIICEFLITYKINFRKSKKGETR